MTPRHQDSNQKAVHGIRDGQLHALKKAEGLGVLDSNNNVRNMGSLRAWSSWMPRDSLYQCLTLDCNCDLSRLPTFCSKGIAMGSDNAAIRYDLNIQRSSQLMLVAMADTSSMMLTY